MSNNENCRFRGNDFWIMDQDAVYTLLKSTESIIFDVGNYPNMTILPLSKLLLPKNTIYYQFNFPETNYPSKFYNRKNSIERRNLDYYKGK